MSGNAEIRLNLLLFSVGGVHFGMDAEMDTGITEYNGEKSEDLFWFHEEMGYCCDSLVYHAPSVVTVMTEEFRSYRVIIDSMEDVAEISVKEICPFPPLLELAALRKGMWGIVNREDRMILLVDLQRLLRFKGHCIKPNGGNIE